MGSWYWIGVSAGLGVAIGVLLAGVLAATRALLIAALVLAAGAVVGGALTRGGTRGGTAFLILVAALGLAALAFVPAVGYLEAVALVVLAVRARRRRPGRYAGLRSLARD